MDIKGRKIYGGKAEGEILKTNEPISFLGGVDPEKGIVVEKGHEIEGKSVRNKVLVFPKGKGSTVGSYTIYQLKKNKVAPAAIINKKCEPIVAIGAVISSIPTLDKIDMDDIPSQGRAIVNSNKEAVEIIDF